MIFMWDLWDERGGEGERKGKREREGEGEGKGKTEEGLSDEPRP